MDEDHAQLIADMWSGSGGLVPRGPKIVLACKPATPSDVERHTRRRPLGSSRLWRLEVGGRFLAAGGLVYPGGVPYPEDLQRRTALIANEVWLYVDDDGDVLGAYWWPDAVRRPIASVPRDEYSPDDVVAPVDIASHLEFAPRMPCSPSCEPVAAVCLTPTDVIVFFSPGPIPDPLHEMLLFELGGLSFRASVEQQAPDHQDFLREHQPPYRQLRVGRSAAVGREPGRSLGPQTWPWPGELRWWDDGVSYELKGFVALSTLQEIAATASS